jgi:RNA polymerase sigma-70 factor (ECF subfamily)
MVAVEVEPPDVEDATTDFVRCYQLHYRRLVKALRLGGATPAAAEDLAQEAFARALGRWRKVSKGSNPAGYVYVTGFRLLHRSLKRESRWEVEEIYVYGPAAEDEAIVNVAVDSVLARMPPKRRACAVMCLVLGLPVREAAATLKIADGTVRKHLEEARKDLAVVVR